MNLFKKIRELYCKVIGHNYKFKIILDKETNHHVRHECTRCGDFHLEVDKKERNFGVNVFELAEATMFNSLDYFIALAKEEEHQLAPALISTKVVLEGVLKILKIEESKYVEVPIE